MAEFYRNQRATRLWNFSRNPRLAGLRFDDFARLHDLSDLRTGGSPSELATLSDLRSLKFDAKRINDGRIEPLGELTGLHALTFPTNMFTIRQVAWLRARLPASLESKSLAPMVQVNPPLEDDAKTKMFFSSASASRP